MRLGHFLLFSFCWEFFLFFNMNGSSILSKAFFVYLLRWWCSLILSYLNVVNYSDWSWNIELASPSQDKSHLIVTSFFFVAGFYLLMFYWGGKNQETQPYWSFFTFLCICLLLLTSQILQIVASLLSVVCADFQLESVEEIKCGKLTPSCEDQNSVSLGMFL